MDDWKQNFLDKLREAQTQCAKQFEDALDRFIVPVFDGLSEFLQDNGFRVSSPLNETGRRSFKFELAENAYLLVIFRFSGVAEFELRCETFVPGAEPVLEKNVGRVSDVNQDWARELLHAGLDHFVELLSGKRKPEPAEELAAV